MLTFLYGKNTPHFFGTKFLNAVFKKAIKAGQIHLTSCPENKKTHLIITYPPTSIS